MSQSSSPTENAWSFYSLPPFFTEQPAAGTLERQTALWHSIILDHAVMCAEKASKTSSKAYCPLIRVYHEKSPIFLNTELQRRLPPASAKKFLESLAVQHPNRVVVAKREKEHVKVLVCTHKGGVKGLEESLLRWVLEVGVGTTSTMLSQKGAVLTFEEMSNGKALYHHGKSAADTIASRLFPSVASFPGAPDGSAECVSDEDTLRLILSSQPFRPKSSSPLEPFALTMFNVDGSESEPYDGVKLGGK